MPAGAKPCQETVQPYLGVAVLADQVTEKHNLRVDSIILPVVG